MTKEFLQPSLVVERIAGKPPQVTEPKLEELAEVYANAFAGPPWNEYTVCPTENTFYGKETRGKQPCPCCNTPLALAYPRKETMGYITQELAKPDAALFVLRNGEKIAGFSWGFSYENPTAFVREKYRTTQMQQTVANLLTRQGITDKVYYLSESGLLDDAQYRGRGLSSQFHQVRLAVAKELGIPALQRTSCEGPMYRVSQKSGMTQIMGPEVRVDTQARTFERTGNIINNCIDTEIEPRVLFMVE